MWFFCIIRGLPFSSVKFCFKSWGLPWKLVWKLRGLPWNIVEILAVVMISRPISPVCELFYSSSLTCVWVWHVTRMKIHMSCHTHERRALSSSRATHLSQSCVAHMTRFPQKILHPQNPPKSRNSNSSVQIQIKSQSQFEFAPRDLEESEFSIWWILGVQQFQWKLSYEVVVLHIRASRVSQI